MKLSGHAILLLMSATLAFGQTAKFEVASIRPSGPYPPQGGVNSNVQGGPGTADPTHIRRNFASIKNLIDAAFLVKPYQVTGPSFLDSESFNIAATVPEGATKEQVQEMWRNLLIERFGMVAHVEKRDFDARELVISRSGAKLKPTEMPDAEQPAPQNLQEIFESGKLKAPGIVAFYRAMPGGPVATLMAKAQSTSKIANQIEAELGEPVVDKTGLTGKYDFEFEYTPRSLRDRAAGGASLTPTNGIDLVSAIEDNLGLRLQKGKASLDHVIIDKIERVPTEN